MKNKTLKKHYIKNLKSQYAVIFEAVTLHILWRNWGYEDSFQGYIPVAKFPSFCLFDELHALTLSSSVRWFFFIIIKTNNMRKLWLFTYLRLHLQ